MEHVAGVLLVERFRSHNLAPSVLQDICKDSKSQQLLQQEVHRFIADKHSKVHEQDLVSLQVGHSTPPIWLAMSGSSPHADPNICRSASRLLCLAMPQRECH